MEQQNFNIHQDIIDRCLLGDRHAQYMLYKLYAKAMFNVSLRIVNNAEDAEDILQEAFVSAFRSLSSYKGDSAFGAWLKRIVINKSLNLLKKKTVDVTSMDDLPEVVEEFDHIDFNDKLLSVDRIKKAMNQLPDGYRTVFSLYLFEGYDHNEIGHILGISESTSKSQFNRSKKKLKEILERQ